MLVRDQIRLTRLTLRRTLAAYRLAAARDPLAALILGTEIRGLEIALGVMADLERRVDGNQEAEGEAILN